MYIANNIIMIYIVGLITGILNGLFASGAGQILVFYLIYILKQETHMSRAASVSVLSISSIFALFGYAKIINFEIVTKTENLFGLSIENFNGLMYINNENRCSISESVC